MTASKRYDYMLEFPEHVHVWGSEYDDEDDPETLLGRFISVGWTKGRYGGQIVKVDIDAKEEKLHLIHYPGDGTKKWYKLNFGECQVCMCV